MDIGKIFGLALLPIVILVVLGTLASFIGLIPVVGPAIVCLSLPLSIIVNLGVLGWAGYSAGKAKLDLISCALTGVITGVIGGLINAVIGIVLGLLGVGVSVATGGDATTGILGAGMGFVVAILGALLGGVILGGILGIIGGLVAGAK